MGLVARALERAGVPTVILGSARDIVEECGVPRFLFTDFPLGNPCGKPDDRAMQREIVGQGLDLLERAWMPRTTVQTPFAWAEDDAWKVCYARVDPANEAALRRAGERRRAQQQQAHASGRARSG